MAEEAANVFDMPSFFLMTPDIVCIASGEGYFKKVNQSMIEKMEYSEEELLSTPVSSFVHPDDRAVTDEKRNLLLTGEVLRDFENRYVARSGRIIWMQWTSVFFPEHNLVLAIAKDVTEKKKMEEEMLEKYNRFRGLTDYFKNSIEKDRRYLAGELHEELAQMISVIRTDLTWLENNTQDLPEASRNRVEHAIAVSSMLLEGIRKISFVIGPGMLEDLGLLDTLEWLSREFSVLSGITCHFESNCQETDIPPEIKLDFFRICQEALDNVIAHARADATTVRLKKEKGTLCLSIEDDGCGFLPDQVSTVSGMMVMKERAASVNCQFSVTSRLNKGTLITVCRQAT